MPWAPGGTVPSVLSRQVLQSSALMLRKCSFTETGLHHLMPLEYSVLNGTFIGPRRPEFCLNQFVLPRFDSRTVWGLLAEEVYNPGLSSRNISTTWAPVKRALPGHTPNPLEQVPDAGLRDPAF